MIVEYDLCAKVEKCDFNHNSSKMFSVSNLIKENLYGLAKIQMVLE